MINRPDISFRCGPLALHRILLAYNPTRAAQHDAFTAIFESASTQSGFSLPELTRLSRTVGLNYQMAFREHGADFVVPSVIHWQVGHYAALLRQDGNRFLLQDPTFGTDVWATRDALEAEASGYFLVPADSLPPAWRAVDEAEGDRVRGKGNTGGGCGDKCDKPCDGQSSGEKCCSDPNCGGGPSPPCPGMTVASVHLNTVNLHLQDHPLEYTPPFGPAVRFSVYYNQRDAAQPSIFTYSNVGSKWTSYWTSYIADNPLTPAADVNCYMMGGGIDKFTGFDPATQSFLPQQLDQTQLHRTSLNSYELMRADGSKLIFSSRTGPSAPRARSSFRKRSTPPAMLFRSRTTTTSASLPSPMRSGRLRPFPISIPPTGTRSRE
jgi:hypothetical protein